MGILCRGRRRDAGVLAAVAADVGDPAGKGGHLRCDARYLGHHDDSRAVALAVYHPVRAVVREPVTFEVSQIVVSHEARYFTRCRRTGSATLGARRARAPVGKLLSSNNSGRDGCVMGDRVSYRCADSVAHITMDDGKVNVLSSPMQAELHDALNQAERDEAVVIITGRPGVFSGGFDLGVLRAGGEDALAMLRGGFELAERLLSFPSPVVIACSGHAVAMALFVVLSGDYRIGVTGDARFTANEVAIGLAMPRAAIEICRQRLTPPATRVIRAGGALLWSAGG